MSTYNGLLRYHSIQKLFPPVVLGNKIRLPNFLTYHRPLQPRCPQPYLALLGLPDAHLALQYIHFSGTMQLHAGCAHLLAMATLPLDLHYMGCSSFFGLLQRPKEGHQVLFLLIIQLQLQDEIEELYCIIQRQQTVVVQVRG